MKKILLNLTIKRKLNLISAPYLACIIILLSTFIWFVNNTVNQGEKLNKFSALKVMVEGIQARNNSLQGDLLNMFIIDPVKEKNQMELMVNKYNKTLEELREIKNGKNKDIKLSDELAPKLKAYGADIDNFLNFCEKLKPIAMKVVETDSNYQQVRAKMINEFEPFFRKTLASKADLFSTLEKMIENEVALIEEKTKIAIFTVIIINLILITLAIRTSLFISSTISKTVLYVKNVIARVTEGELPQMEATVGKDEVSEMRTSVSLLINNLTNLKNFTIEVGKGNFTNNITIFNNQGEIAGAFTNMKDALKKASEVESKQRWISQGLADASKTIRKSNNDVASLTEAILIICIKYLNANQGSFFVVNEENNTLDLKASYAYNRKKFITKSIPFGEGLVGQAYLERDIIFLKDVPNDYIQITSGLGEANPTNIIILPLITNEVVQGVLEIASFKPLEEFHIDFLKQLGELIAADISSSRVNIRTQQLLALSQQQTEMMLAAEEELRQNMEEMQATQEEMERKNQELQHLLNLK